MSEAYEAQYQKYEETLLRRDQVKKEAEQINRAYIRTFGDLLEKSFSLKISCIKYKKIIAYCQQKRNCGEEVNRTALDSYITKELSSFYDELHQMQAIRQAETTKLSKEELRQIRTIYRRIAKTIHPDTAPALFAHEEAQLLWHSIVAAYRNNDLEELKNLEVLAAALKRKYGAETDEPEIPDIEERLVKLQAEIDEILTTNPYLYRLLLDDAGAIEKRKAELTEEINTYLLYEAQLKEAAEVYGYGE